VGGLPVTKRSPELRELQEQFKLAVVFGGDPDARPLPCWFSENTPGIDPCEVGPRGIEAAHWIKRQLVERVLKVVMPVGGKFGIPGASGFDREELVVLAAWDSRNAVPSCLKHHSRFDSQRMPPLVIWRHEVPAAVESFTADWGLLTALEDRCPLISSERPTFQGHGT
jgi:hypothetical protein